MANKVLVLFVAVVLLAAGCATAPKVETDLKSEQDSDVSYQAAVEPTVTATTVAIAAAEETQEPSPTPVAVKPKPVETPKRKAETAAVKPELTAVKTPVKRTVLTEEEKVQRLLDALKSKQAKRAAAKMNIQIRTTYTQLGTSQEIKGEIRMKRPDKFMVKYTEPQEQYLYSDGKTIWVYTPAIKQVMKQKTDDAGMDTKMYVEMESAIEYYAGKSKTSLSEDALYYTLKMIPKNKSELNFDEIRVRILKENLNPDTIEMSYEGASVRITFSGIKNYTAEEAAKLKEFADSVFDFKIPDNVEVIDASALMQGGI